MRATLAVIALIVSTSAHAQSDVSIESRPCCELQRAVAARSPEAEVIAAIPNRAFRQGSDLWLKLDGNRSLRIIDCVAFACGASFSTHALVAWWPKHRYYVIDVVVEKGREAYLISERDGRRTSVFAPPVLSPSGRYAVAADLGPEYDGLRIVDMSVDPPSAVEVASRPTCPGSKTLSLRPSPVWLDDSRVGFEGKPFFGDDDPNARQVLRIVDGKPEWEC